MLGSKLLDIGQHFSMPSLEFLIFGLHSAELQLVVLFTRIIHNKQVRVVHILHLHFQRTYFLGLLSIGVLEVLDLLILVGDSRKLRCYGNHMGGLAFLELFPHLSTGFLHKNVFFADRLHFDGHFLLFGAVLVNDFIEQDDLIVHLPKLVGVFYFQSVDVSHMMAATAHRSLRLFNRCFGFFVGSQYHLFEIPQGLPAIFKILFKLLGLLF